MNGIRGRDPRAAACPAGAPFIAATFALVVGWLLLWPVSPGAQSAAVAAKAPGLRVAAASDLQLVFPRLADQFARETGVVAVASFGSSGTFFAQIQNGAPFDLFLSADAEYPARLVADGDADAGTVAEYASGRLVLWARRDGGLDVRRGLAVLSEARVRRIAIANPDHAPYGRAAVAVLRRAGLYDAVRARLVLGENVSQAVQFVESGNADAGLVPLSLALGPAMRAVGGYFEIPPAWHPPIQQTAVMPRSAQNKDGARRFVAFLQRAEAQRVLRASGFAAPRSMPSPESPRSSGRGR